MTSFFIPSLKFRKHKPELMDDLGLNEYDLKKALSGLERLNFLSNVVQILWNEIEQYCKARKTNHVTVLDIACGGGEILRGLSKIAYSRGIRLKCLGLDINPKSVAFASSKSEDGKFEISYEVGDVIKAIPEGFDVVISTLFLHHLTEAEVLGLLAKINKSSNEGLILIHDLKRSRRGYALAFLATQLLSRSKIVRKDALLSVEGAFSKIEMRSILDSAGISNFKIKDTWPCRMLISIEKN